MTYLLCFIKVQLSDWPLSPFAQKLRLATLNFPTTFRVSLFSTITLNAHEWPMFPARHPMLFFGISWSVWTGSKWTDDSMQLKFFNEKKNLKKFSRCYYTFCNEKILIILNLESTGCIHEWDLNLVITVPVPYGARSSATTMVTTELDKNSVIFLHLLMNTLLLVRHWSRWPMRSCEMISSTSSVKISTLAV